MKKLISTLSVISILTGAAASTASAFDAWSYAEDVKVYVDGSKINDEYKPIIVNDRTLVRLVPIFERLGYSHTDMDQDKSVAFIQNGSNARYKFIAEKDYAIVGSDESDKYFFDVPATLQFNDVFYVPIRAFCEMTGCSIEWDNNSRSVYITSNADQYTNVTEPELNITGSYRAYSEDDAPVGIANLDIETNGDGIITMTYHRKNDNSGSNIGPVTMNPQGDGTYIVSTENRSYILKPVDENTVILTIDEDIPETLTFIRL